MGTAIPPDNAFIGSFDALVADHTIPYIKQDKINWCWAACFVMIRSYFNCPPLSQLELASHVFGAVACANPDSSGCNKAAFPDEAANQCGLTCTPMPNAMNETSARYYVSLGPIEILFEKDGGAIRHVVLISQFRDDGTVRLLDPWPDYGESFPNFATLAAGYQAGTWARTYYQFAVLP